MREVIEESKQQQLEQPIGVSSSRRSIPVIQV